MISDETIRTAKKALTKERTALMATLVQEITDYRAGQSRMRIENLKGRILRVDRAFEDLDHERFLRQKAAQRAS